MQAALCGRIRDGLQVPNTPGRVAPSQGRVEVRVAAGGGLVIDQVGAIPKEPAALRQGALRPIEQPQGGRPGADVHHVDGDHHICGGYGPLRGAGVEGDGRQEVLSPRLLSVGLNAPAAGGLNLRGLHLQVGEGPREGEGVLAGAAGHLQQEP